jgi:hypothetical protein
VQPRYQACFVFPRVSSLFEAVGKLCMAVQAASLCGSGSRRGKPHAGAAVSIARCVTSYCHRRSPRVPTLELTQWGSAKVMGLFV